MDNDKQVLVCISTTNISMIVYFCAIVITIVLISYLVLELSKIDVGIKIYALLKCYFCRNDIRYFQFMVMNINAFLSWQHLFVMLFYFRVTVLVLFLRFSVVLELLKIAIWVKIYSLLKSYLFVGVIFYIPSQQWWI